MDTSSIRIQGSFHLWALRLRSGSASDVCYVILRNNLSLLTASCVQPASNDRSEVSRSYFCNWLRFRLPRNCCKSVPSWFVRIPARRQVKQEFLLTVLVCDPPKYSELRIDFTQAFNTIGAVNGPVLDLVSSLRRLVIV